MTKRTWIKIHSGLTNDPKHRARLGVRVWLFMWLIDQVDWTTGIVWDYTDKRAAEALSDEDNKISPRTIEDQRQQLEKDGYITCHASFQCQHIRVMRWRDPREVNPPQINIPGRRETWYDTSRRHTTTLPVPIPAESTVPLPLESQDREIDQSEVKRLVARHFGMELPNTKLALWEFLAEGYGLIWFEDALKETVNQGGGQKMNIKYVRKVLENWKLEGHPASRNGNGHKQDNRPVVTTTPASKRKDYTDVS